MNVDPTHAAAVQLAIASKRHNVAMRNQACLLHTLIGRESLPAATLVAYQEFSKYQFVPAHLVETEQSVQLGCIRLPAGQRSDPNGSVYKHH